MGIFVYKILASDGGTLFKIRCVVGLEAVKLGREIWLRGDEELLGREPGIRQLPVTARYTVDEEGRLFFSGRQTPEALLPQLRWRPLGEFIGLDPPVSAMPGRMDRPMSVRLSVSDAGHEAEAIMVTLDVWKRYAETASAVRLALLRFAVSGSNEVFVCGSPLPPLPGQSYWTRDGIYLPCGYDLEIPMLAGPLYQRLSAGRDCLVLFDQDGDWQEIPAVCLVPVTRAAVRMTEGNIVAAAGGNGKKEKHD